MCLLDFIQVEGGATFIKLLKGDKSYKSLGTSGFNLIPR
jgi:hypothetical protein